MLKRDFRNARGIISFISRGKQGFCFQQRSLTSTANAQFHSGSISSSVALFKNRENGKTFRHFTSHVEASSDRQLVYEGPLSRSVRLVKVFSLTTALTAVAATPFLMLYGKESVPFIGKLAIASTILVAGTSTTFLLHWVSKVYVHKMFYNAASETFIIETMNIFAMRREIEFGLNDIRLAKEPTAFTTFQAKGKKYFLHTDLLEAQQVMQFIRENRS